MFVNSIKVAQKAMFPIFSAQQLQEEKKVIISIKGTGFFINSEGYFISVAHIFDQENKNTEFLYFGNLPDDLCSPSLRITEIARRDESDIFLGRIDKKDTDFFPLSEKVPDVGRSVCVGGYPLAEITPNSSGGVELGGVRRYFQPSFVLDRVTIKTLCDNKKTRTHDGFLVRDFGLFGMSGGPVFDTDALLVGVQGSVTAPRISKNSTGRELSVENAVAIRSDLVITLLKENNIKFSSC